MKIPDDLLRNGNEEASTVRSGTSCNILVLEDEVILRKLITTILTEAGYHPFATDDGFEALHHILEEQSTDLALVNLQMPEMTGTEFLQRLQELPSRIRPACIIVSGRPLPQKEKDAYRKFGVVDFVPKPFKLKRLTVAIESALRQIHQSKTSL